MPFKKITAIISEQNLEKVLTSLDDAGATWVTVCKQHGHGEYRNYFVKHYMGEFIRIEVFIEHEKVKDIVNAIGYAAYDGIESDGMIAVELVEDFLPVKEFKERQDDVK